MKLFPMVNKLSFFILLAIILLSFFLGSKMILAGDFYFLYDQARDLLLTKNIAVDHDLTLIGSRSGIGGFFHGPLYLYLLVPFFLLGGGNPSTFLFFHVAMGIATIIVGYIVGKKLYDERVGLLVAFLLGISPRIWSYFSVTQGLNLIPLIYLGLFYSLVTYFRGQRKMFIWVAIFTGLTFQFETATSLILVPIVAILYFLLPGAHKHWKIIASSIGAFVLSVGSFILFDLRHQFLMTTSVISYIRYGEKGPGYLPLAQRIASHANSLVETFQAILIERTLILEALLLLVIISICLLMIGKRIKKQLKKELLLFGLFPVATFAFLLLYPRLVYAEYVLGLTVPIIFFVSLGLALLWKEKYGKLLVGLFILVQVSLAFFLLYSQYKVPYQDASAGSYRNQKAAADWIFTDAKGGQFGYFVYTPEIFTVGMDYLFWWEGTKIYNNLPTNTKQPTTYLVLYPPLEFDDGAHAYWKKTVVRTQGKVVTRKIFPGGIIVEKLQIPPGDPEPDPNYYQNLIFR